MTKRKTSKRETVIPEFKVSGDSEVFNGQTFQKQMTAEQNSRKFAKKDPSDTEQILIAHDEMLNNVSSIAD